MTEFTIEPIGAKQVLVVAPQGPELSLADFADLVGNAAYQRADCVLVPVTRLGGEFFELRTGFAGEVTQKFANYRLLLAIAGDVRAHETKSTSFRDFVREANRGSQVWFVADRDALATRLTAG